MVIDQVAALFFMIVAGFAARRLKIVPDAFGKHLSGFLFNFAMPAMIFMSFQVDYTPERLSQVGLVALCSLLIHLAGLLIFGLVYRRETPEKRSVMWFSSLFSNAGYMAMPVLGAAFGETGLMLGAVNMAVFNLVQFSGGIMVFTGARSVKQTLRELCNPPLLASLAGFVFFILHITLPSMLFGAIDMLGDVASPMGMLLVGISLADSPLREMFTEWRAFLVTAVRLILFPAAVWGALWLCGTEQTVTAVLVAVFAMPTAANTAVLAQRFRADAPLAARCIFISSLLSIGTVPLWLYILGA